MKKQGTPMPAVTKKDISNASEELYGKVIEPPFDRIESHIQSQIGPRFDRIESYIQNRIELRFDRIDQKLEEHDRKFNDLLNHFNQIYTRLDRLETEGFSITAALRRIEERLDVVEGKLDRKIATREKLERKISHLKQRAIALQSRIEEMEERLKTLP